LTSSLPLDEPLSTAPTGPLADAVSEARRIIGRADDEGLTVRALGGVAVYLQSPAGRPMLPRTLKDIDLVTTREGGRRTAQLLQALGYRPEEMFNALHGSRRQLYRDPVNARNLDVFVGEFSMCHAIPVADRLERDPLTVPLAELLLTKLQVVELTERDESDIYTLCFHHEISDGATPGIEVGLIAELCANDWGLWRTCRGTIERCRADVDRYALEPSAREIVDGRLGALWDSIDGAPKTGRWRRRSRLGERKRWYQEPEEDV
jgi:hypothetical protein